MKKKRVIYSTGEIWPTPLLLLNKIGGVDDFNWSDYFE